MISTPLQAVHMNSSIYKDADCDINPPKTALLKIDCLIPNFCDIAEHCAHVLINAKSRCNGV